MTGREGDALCIDFTDHTINCVLARLVVSIQQTVRISVQAFRGQALLHAGRKLENDT